jgi:hypothetical protein
MRKTQLRDEWEVGRKLYTLVPTLDYFPDTDLSDNGVSPDQ